LFASRDEVLYCARSVAHDIGFIAVIMRSDTNTSVRGMIWQLAKGVLNIGLRRMIWQEHALAVENVDARLSCMQSQF